MILYNNLKASNISLDDLYLNRPIRNTFKRSFQTLNNYTNIYSKLRHINSREEKDIQLYNELETLCKKSIDNRYRILQIEDTLPIVFKHKGKTIKTLIEYNPSHIRSSVIKSILLDGVGDINVRIDKMLYILYVYWFVTKGQNQITLLSNNKTNNIKEITHNVCIDIETIISTIIDKSFTLYKDYTITGEIVNSLRDKLIHEKLLNASDL